MENVARAIVKTISRKMGGQLEAVYLYGSVLQGHYQPGESDINLLAVVADGTSIHALRQHFLPLWEEHGELLHRMPLIAQHTAFQRHIQLNPMFAHHLARIGKPLLGAPDFLEDLPAINPHEVFAYLASEAIRVSAAIAPDLLAPEIAEQRLRQLRRLVRRIRGQSIPEEETAVQLFAYVQHYLATRIARLPAAQQWTDTRTPSTTSLLIPGLQAIYKMGDSMVLVFAKLPPQQIIRTSWDKISERLANQCSGLLVTTAVQLRLVLAYDSPIDFHFNRYEHSWGLDPLAGLEVSKRQLLRHAARKPSRIQIDTLPNAYLSGRDDEQIHEIIHDFQNMLLNIQLEHELLNRLGEIERFTPPAPLPDRAAPSPQRIDAIFQHLGWWAGFYTEKMLKYE